MRLPLQCLCPKDPENRRSSASTLTLEGSSLDFIASNFALLFSIIDASMDRAADSDIASFPSSNYLHCTCGWRLAVRIPVLSMRLKSVGEDAFNFAIPKPTQHRHPMIWVKSAIWEREQIVYEILVLEQQMHDVP